MEQKQEGKRNSHVIRRAPFRLQWRLFAFFQPDTVLTTLTPLSPPFLPLFPHVVRDRPRTFTFAIPLRPRVLPPTLASHLQPCTLDRGGLPGVLRFIKHDLVKRKAAEKREQSKNPIWKDIPRGNNKTVRLLQRRYENGSSAEASSGRLARRVNRPLSLERIRAEILTQLGKHSNRSGNATLKSLKEKSKRIFIPSGPINLDAPRATSDRKRREARLREKEEEQTTRNGRSGEKKRRRRRAGGSVQRR